jgi:hypothetical protein
MALAIGMGIDGGSHLGKAGEDGGIESGTRYAKAAVPDEDKSVLIV